MAVDYQRQVYIIRYQKLGAKRKVTFTSVRLGNAEVYSFAARSAECSGERLSYLPQK